MAKYGQAVDRNSAYEMLTARVAPSAPAGTAPVTLPTVPAGQPGAAGTNPAQPGPPGQPVPTLGPDGWPTLVPEPYNPYLDTPVAPAPQPAPRGSGAGSGGIGDLLNNPVVTSFMKSLGTSLGGALGRSVSGTRKRRR